MKLLCTQLRPFFFCVIIKICFALKGISAEKER